MSTKKLILWTLLFCAASLMGPFAILMPLVIRHHERSYLCLDLEKKMSVNKMLWITFLCSFVLGPLAYLVPIIIWTVGKKKFKKKLKQKIEREKSEAEEQERKKRQHQLARQKHYMNSKKVDEIVAFIMQKGLPYKVVINFGDVVAYHRGGSVCYDFLTNGWTNFEDIYGYTPEENDMYYFGQALNKKMGGVFTVIDQHRTNVVGTWPNEIYHHIQQCVELVRQLDKI